MRDNTTIATANRLLPCAIAAMTLLGAVPAFADTDGDIAELRKAIATQQKQIADQNKLIQQLLGDQQAKMQATPPGTPTGSPGNQPGLQKEDDLKPTFAFYGTLDVNVINENAGNGNKFLVGSGGLYATSFGVKINRDLGSRTHAFAELEAGVGINNGTVGNGATTTGIGVASPSSGGLLGTGPQLLARQTYAGMSHDQYGSIALGRQYAPSYIGIAGHGTALGGGFLGNPSSILTSIGGMPTRFNNAINYVSPTIAGFKGQIEYTTGSENNVGVPTAVGTNTTTADGGRGFDSGITYKNGKFDGMFSTWRVKAATYATTGEGALATKRGVQLDANYDFGFVKLYGAFVSGKISGGNYENTTKVLSKSQGEGVSAMIPFMQKHRVYLGWSRIDDQGLLNRDATLLGVSYAYDIMPGYKVYASFAKLINNPNASYSLLDGADILATTSKVGFNPRGIVTGVNYSF